MKTRYRFLFLLLLAVCLLPARSQDQGELLPEERYTRNSASVIRIEYGDSLDAGVAAHFSNAQLGDRFDVNEIALQTLKIEGSRAHFFPEGSIWPKAPDRTELISSMLNVFTRLTWGSYRGDRVGIYNYNTIEDKGFVDIDFFKYTSY
jgi:hypothetical protein